MAHDLNLRDASSPRVLDAMRRVPRERFVPSLLEPRANDDRALSIGYGQTISQPYIVAMMTELSGAGPGSRVLEIGTGSGYQAAILAEVGATVYTIEIVEPLANRAGSLFAELGYDTIHPRTGDGYGGWPEQAPFDAVVVTAAPTAIPPALEEQLLVGGKLVVPVGQRSQELVVVTRTADGYERRRVFGVRFVPMTGRAERC